MVSLQEHCRHEAMWFQVPTHPDPDSTRAPYTVVYTLTADPSVSVFPDIAPSSFSFIECFSPSVFHRLLPLFQPGILKVLVLSKPLLQFPEWAQLWPQLPLMPACWRLPPPSPAPKAPWVLVTHFQLHQTLHRGVSGTHPSQRFQTWTHHLLPQASFSLTLHITLEFEDVALSFPKSFPIILTSRVKSIFRKNLYLVSFTINLPHILISYSPSKLSGALSKILNFTLE